MVKLTKMQSFSSLSFWLFVSVLYKEKKKENKKQLQNEIDLSKTLIKQSSPCNGTIFLWSPKGQGPVVTEKWGHYDELTNGKDEMLRRHWWVSDGSSTCSRSWARQVKEVSVREGKRFSQSRRGGAVSELEPRSDDKSSSPFIKNKKQNQRSEKEI